MYCMYAHDKHNHRTITTPSVLPPLLLLHPPPQAWGLMELQKGNFWAAVRLLERSVVMDPFLTPVLRWKPVNAARNTLVGSSRYRPLRARGTATAAAGAGGAAAAGTTGGSSVCSSGGSVGGISGGAGTGGSMSSM